jgi:hypothetical protein
MPEPAPAPIVTPPPAVISLSAPPADPVQTAGFGALLGSVDPSGHVLAAVTAVREQSGATQQGSSGGAGMPMSIGAGLGVDVSLHVLPAVNRVSSETRAMADTATAAAGSFADNGILPSSINAPTGSEVSAASAITIDSSRPADTPPPQPDSGRTPERIDDTAPVDPSGTSPASPQEPALPIARRSFGDQLRLAANARSTRLAAQALQRTIAPTTERDADAAPQRRVGNA